MLLARLSRKVCIEQVLVVRESKVVLTITVRSNFTFPISHTSLILSSHLPISHSRSIRLCDAPRVLSREGLVLFWRDIKLTIVILSTLWIMHPTATKADVWKIQSNGMMDTNWKPLLLLLVNGLVTDRALIHIWNLLSSRLCMNLWILMSYRPVSK
jgi:hypothetical protein